MATIQIPVLFDMSGDTVVFGEEATGDFVGSHLDFLLDMTTEANDISLNAADISAAILVGDQDTGDNIFYSGGSSGNVAVDNLCNRIAKAITRGKLVHIPKTGNSSNSGIPMGGRLYVVRADGQQELPPDGQYAEKYPHSIAPIGDEQMLGEAMARVTSVHLMGTPLPASILVNKNSVQSDLETASGQTFNDGNTAFYNALAVQLSKVLGGSKSSAPMNNGSGSGSSGSETTVPYDLASINSPLSGQTYSSSTDHNSSLASPRAFDDNITTSWISLEGTYSSGSYNGSVSTEGYAGEWVQVDVGQNVLLTSYEIFPRQLADSAHPKKMRFFYSTDGSSWTQLQDWDNLTLENNWKSNGSYGSVGPYYTSTVGRYFRLVINELLSTGTYCQITELKLKGLLPSQGSAPTPDPYDVASFNSSLSGQTYTSSSTYREADYAASEAFDNSWTVPNDSWVTGKDTYSNGTYVGSESTDGYAGEWVQVDIGQEVVLKSFEIHPRYQELSSHAPKNMRLFSSADGTNWSQLYDWVGLTNDDWYPDGNSVGPYTTNTTGRYFRLVLNEGIGNAAYLQLSEIVLKGILPSQISDGSSGGSSGGSSSGYPLDASGVAVPALKSIYEQLMNVPGRSQIMETRDISGVQDNSNVTLTGGFPFIPGDKLVMYLRPKIVFAAQTQAENNNALYTFNYTGTTVVGVPVYNIADKNGDITGQTYTHSSSQNNTGFIFEKATTGAGITGSDYWTSAGNTYAVTTGVHEGTNANGTTTNVDGGDTISGEWGQVDIGESTWATELKLTTNNSYNNRMPVEFRLLGSIDGTNWKTLIHETEAGPWSDNIAETYSIVNPEPLRYYRYVVIKTHGDADARTSLGYFNLKGVKYPSEVTEVSDPGLMSGTTLDISGLQTNVVASSANIYDAFPGNATSGPEAEPSKWGWMGSANSDSLSLDTTDITDPRTIDLHIWKITITL